MRQEIVHAVAIDGLDAGTRHVLEAAGRPQRPVDAPVAVRRLGDGGGGRHQDLPILLREARQAPLSVEEDLVLLEAEIGVLLKVRLGVLTRELAQHDVPHDRLADLGALAESRLGRELLQRHDALRLNLKQGLLGGKFDVNATLGKLRSQPRALASREQHDAHLAVGDQLVALVREGLPRRLDHAALREDLLLLDGLGGLVSRALLALAALEVLLQLREVERSGVFAEPSPLLLLQARPLLRHVTLADVVELTLNSERRLVLVQVFFFPIPAHLDWFE
mmetsp:Transcript_15644/g.39806  ORF Transcript_15644/g.39806 Transcript_15644/m.39806 type:complete len:278 (+) Transcript_15644:1073-1906(+)